MNKAQGGEFANFIVVHLIEKNRHFINLVLLHYPRISLRRMKWNTYEQFWWRRIFENGKSRRLEWDGNL